jgi:hypothetical protein
LYIGGCFLAIKFDLAGLRLAVVGRWPLFRGGRCSEVAVSTGLTARLTKNNILYYTILASPSCGVLKPAQAVIVVKVQQKKVLCTINLICFINVKSPNLEPQPQEISYRERERDRERETERKKEKRQQQRDKENEKERENET